MGIDAPEYEAQRLTVLARSGLLDTASEPAFDDLAALAARLFDVPAALVTLMDADRLWFKAQVGAGVAEVDRKTSFCDLTLRGTGLLVIEDAAVDPRFADNPHVAGAPHLRFYAGYPLIVTGGWALGTFCLMDYKPRRLSEDEAEALATLAKSAAALIDLRLREADLQAALADRDTAARALGEQAKRLTGAQRVARLGSWEYLFDSDQLSWSREVFDILGVDPNDHVPTRALWLSLLHPEDRQWVTDTEERLWHGEQRQDLELRIVRPDGEVRHVWSRAETIADGAGRRLVGTTQDVTERKLMEARLVQAESDLALAGRLSRMGAWSVELASGKVTWSDEVYAIHEIPLGTRITHDEGINYFAPEYRELAKRDFAACVNEGVPFDREHELITAKGRRIWVRGIGQAQRDEHGRIVGVRGAFQDIDAHKRNELEVRRLAERLEITLESITDAFMTVDRDWRFTYINAEAERRIGRPRAEILGRDMWETFPDVVGSRMHEHNERAMREGVAVAFEEYYEPTKSWLSVRVYPSSEGLAIYWQDVTQARRATEALRESEERFKLVARATADTVWDHDRRTGTQWWSEDFAARLGYSAAELPPCSESWRRVVHPDDLHRVLAAQQAAFDAGAGSWEAGYRLIRRDGKILHVLDRAFLMRDAEGKVIREVGGLTDISHRMEYEERLHQAQRLEAIGQLTGGIAHDFNNLLTVILGNAELLGERLAADERSRRLAEMTASAAHRGAELTSRLLTFARRQTLHPKAVDVNRLIAGMDGLLRRALGEQVEIEIVRGGGLWAATADPAQLESAILNLCINARDAMPGGGRLSIETANVHLDDSYVAGQTDVAAGQYVMIAVADTGTGMAADVLAQAFEPFYTTKGPGKGSGLGLSVVYGFVKQSGGHVKIYSELGEGTTVKIYLPRSSAQAGVQADAGRPTPEHGGQERILVVEDDDLVRSHVTQQVQALGYSVVAAANGPEAIAILRTEQPFDLLFTDVVMPGGMNGRQVADEARRLRPGLRVLFTSGYTENAIVHHGRLDRGVHLINKPYRRQDLARKLRLVLEEPVPADEAGGGAGNGSPA
jgi:PAS domain S-box-containing protein